MGSCEGSSGIRKGSIGIRMKGMGSITFSNGSGRPDGAAQHGIQYGIRWDQWVICWDPMDPAGLTKVKGSIGKHHRIVGAPQGGS